MALPSFPQVEKCPFGTISAASYQCLIFFLSHTAFPFLILFTLKTQPQCPLFPGNCSTGPAPVGDAAFPLTWSCSWALGRNCMELGNLHFPFSFLSLQARLALPELTLHASLAGLRAVLGHQTAPNPFSGAQQPSVVSSGLGGSRPPALSALSMCPGLLAGCHQ